MWLPKGQQVSRFQTYHWGSNQASSRWGSEWLGPCWDAVPVTASQLGKCHRYHVEFPVENGIDMVDLCWSWISQKVDLLKLFSNPLTIWCLLQAGLSEKMGPPNLHLRGQFLSVIGNEPKRQIGWSSRGYQFRPPQCRVGIILTDRSLGLSKNGRVVTTFYKEKVGKPM